MTKNSSLLHEYLEHLVSLRRSEATIESYERILTKMQTFLNDNFGIKCSDRDSNNIKGHMLDKFYRTFTTQSVATRNLYVVIMQEFFKFLKNSGYIEENPSNILRRERVRKDDDPDDADQIDKAYSASDVVELILFCGGQNAKRDRAIIATLTAGGFRASELCSMNISTYRNMKSGRMYVKRKGGSWKWVTVADYAMQYIDDYLEERGSVLDDEPLFTTREGKRLNRNTLWVLLSRRQKELEMHTGVHILRHTFLTGAQKAGGMAVAKDLANHSSMNTTNVYIHTTANERKAAANNMEWAQVLSR